MEGDSPNARLSYPTENLLSNKNTRNRIVLSFKESPRRTIRTATWSREGETGEGKTDKGHRGMKCESDCREGRKQEREREMPLMPRAT